MFLGLTIWNWCALPWGRLFPLLLAFLSELFSSHIRILVWSCLVGSSGCCLLVRIEDNTQAHCLRLAINRLLSSQIRVMVDLCNSTKGICLTGRSLLLARELRVATLGAASQRARGRKHT